MSVVFGLSLLFPVTARAEEARRAIFELTVNGVDKGDVLVLLRDGDIWIRVAGLGQAGLRGVAGRRETIAGEEYVSLASLEPGVTFELDTRDLVLRLTAQPEFFGPTVLEFEAGRPRDLVYSRNASAFVNYAVSALDFEQYQAFAETGLSLGPYLLAGAVSRTPDAGLVRGLTTYTLDDRRRLTRWQLGDSVGGSGTLGTSLVMGGLGVSRAFALDPYFIRYPTPELSGAVLTPSTADVYVNDVLVGRETLPPGPFTLRHLPVPAGIGTARVVIRDPFGREQEVATPFYFTTALLDRGVHEFSYHVGFPRENLGTASFDYGSLAFLGQHRLGVLDGLTAGLRLELSSEVASGGPGLTARLPWGEVELAAAASRDGDREGYAGSLAYRFLGRPVSFGGAVRLLSDDYATLGLGAAADRAQLEASAFVGVTVGPRASVTLQYTRQNPRDDGHRDHAALLVSIRLTDRASLLVGGSHSRQDTQDSTNGLGTPPGQETVTDAFVSLTYFFGRTTTGTVSGQWREDEGGGGIELQRPLPVGSGLGYRVRATRVGDRDLAAGVVQYQGPYGRYEAGYEHSNGDTASTLSMAGGLMAVGGAVYPTRPIQESFGLIRVPRVEGVRGYVSNQEIGRTNARGDLPVPSLLAYYGNRLSIKDEDIPLDHRVDAVERTVAPPVRGGALVTFPVRPIQVLTGTIVVERAGEATIPAHGQLTVSAAGTAFDSPIGRRGEFYIESLPAGRHPAVIEHEGTTCRFTFDAPVSTEPVLELGRMRCVAGDGEGGRP